MRSFLLLSVLFLFSAFCQAQPDTVHTVSGLRYVVLENGNGKLVKKGAKVKVHYTGRLTNGFIFDSSEGSKPIKLKAGTGEVIPGWDEMLLLMRKGQEVEVHIPAYLAYADRGVAHPEEPGNYLIPPGSDLIFRMKIVDVK
ncbi:MAG TPA: FKBP-type peptidyl-prolyl cis-trans isomerase [Adhaeribacter sp.]|nr:FKBP-type peptidyl-prolyl cis-trans isomerase [Adhaeribacter sp.]